MSESAAGRWTPTHSEPLLIQAMDQRDSFAKAVFDVTGEPTPDEVDRMRRAKQVIYAGFDSVRGEVSTGRPGVLVDEQLGPSVIDDAKREGVVLAVPIEASGHDWFTLEWGDAWLEHVRSVAPAYAKVLVRDNPDLDATRREQQLRDLSAVSAALREAGVPLLYELLVPATDDQLNRVGGDVDAYDRDVRPELVARVLADNQRHEVEPALWKVEGFETVEAARLVADAAHAGGRTTDLIVLGRDAPKERVDHWLSVAVQVEAFVGFAIGRSIWLDTIGSWRRGEIDEAEATARIGRAYLGYTADWRTG